MSVKHLTGRRRHRAENGKLILQLEESTYDQTGYMQSRDNNEWRDATIEDVTLVDKTPVTESPL